MTLVDVSSFPLVAVNWPPGEASDRDIDQILDEMRDLLGRPHAVLHSGLPSSLVGAHRWGRLADYTKRHRDEIRRWVVASAAVAPSALQRGVVMVIQWIAPPPCPSRMFAERRDAEAWLLEMLRKQP